MSKVMRSRSKTISVSVSLAGCVAVLPTGCVPEFEEDLSRVSSGVILAVRAEPAEAKENQPVALSALVATDVDRPVGDPTFRFCVARKPLSELGPVDPSCLAQDDDSESLVLLGSGERVEALVPETACMAFGPRRPPPEPGKPAARPVDPDPTGGYYQPVVASLGGSSRVLGAVRLECGLIGAERAQVIEYNQRFRANQNPEVASLEFRQAGRWSELGPASSDAVVRVRRAARIDLRVSWSDCAQVPADCEEEQCPEPAEARCSGAESYSWFDPSSRTLEQRRESISASWFTTDGTFDDYRSEPNRDGETSASNSWTAPSRPGRVLLWVVLRDGRGGVGWGSSVVEVE